MSQSKEKEILQLTAFKSILIVYLSINPFTNIKTDYGFQRYHFLKDKVALLLL